MAMSSEAEAGADLGEVADSRGGLLGLLVEQHRLKPEVVATESLTYLLADGAARKALDELGRVIQPSLPAIEKWRGEVVDPQDRSRVDLAGYVGGVATWLLEAKFWAPLQATQPSAYLRRLEGRAAGLLLFVVPGVRIRTLWSEVMRRVEEEHGVGRDASEPIGRGLVSALLPDGRAIAMVSWEALLKPALEAATSTTRGRWEQLAELAAWQDTEALPPLTEEDLSSATGTHLYKLLGVLEGVAAELRDDHGWTFVISTGWSYNGFRLRCGTGHPLWFGLWLYEWHQGGHPVWIQSESSRPLGDPDHVDSTWRTGMEFGRSVKGSNSPRVPLAIARNVEEHHVRRSLVEQVRLAHALVHPDCPATTNASSR